MKQLGKCLLFIIMLVFSPGIFSFSQLQLSESTSLGSEQILNATDTKSKPFTVRKIYISGNKRTNKKIILREVPFQPGEEYQLSDLVKKFEQARQQLMNTVLFHEVVVALKSFDGYYVDILVEVKERWYLFPVPYFKIVDRNINQWIVEQNASLDRVNYGLKFLFNNATGNNDKLNLWLIGGYTKQVSLSYDKPYIDKKMKWGMNVGFAFGKNREINYQTENNKQLFFKDTFNFVRNFFISNFELTYRPAIKTRHKFGVGYVREKVSDTVVALNPYYFKDGMDETKYPELYYIMNYMDVDYIPYPLKGYIGEISVSKKGFMGEVDIWQLTAKGNASWKITDKTYFGTVAYGILKLPFKQPYYYQRLLGYSDFFMQGYEYYVVDGVAGGYVKTSLTRELVNLYIHSKKKKTGEVIRFPFRLYAKVFGNAGYMHHPNPGENLLNNKMLYSYGVGIDMITHYDFTIKFEWSFNRLGENGLYLHRKSYY
jgi:outer membrane protein assembly factor BamA